MPLTRLKRSTYIDAAHKDPKRNGFVVAKSIAPAEIMGSRKGTYLFRRGEHDTLLCFVAHPVTIPGMLTLPDNGNGSFIFKKVGKPSTINVLLGAGVVSRHSDMASLVEESTARTNAGRLMPSEGYDRFLRVLKEGMTEDGHGLGLSRLLGITLPELASGAFTSTLPVCEILRSENVSPPEKELMFVGKDKNGKIVTAEVDLQLTDLIRTAASLSLVLPHELRQIPGIKLE